FERNLFDPFEAGMRVAQRLVEEGCLPDALVCTNDNYAFGTLTVLLKAGIAIPQETVLTGFDNLTYTTQGAVSLTTVEQPIEAMCTAAMELLKKRIGKPRPTGKTRREEIVLPCRVVWRESTVSPHGANFSEDNTLSFTSVNQSTAETVA